jgi:benzodiazapine receptor
MLKEYIISGCSVIATIVLSSKYTTAKTEWYKCIKPRNITPPSFVFPIVWSILYFTIFLSFANVIRDKYIIIQLLFVITLVLNVVWCYLYFGKREIAYAFIVILFMILNSIIIVLLALKKKDIHLVKLHIPYLAWICFAALLNGLSIAKVKTCKDLFF